MEYLATAILALLTGLTLSASQLFGVISYHTSFLTDYFDKSTEIYQAVPATLNSQFKTPDSIPNLLRDSLSYQQALVLDSFYSSENIVEDPKESLVNIRCSYLSDDTIKSTTGSGFFINENGVILTSAHVAQYFLLETYQNSTTDCTIHTGEPATPQYKGTILYISPAWIQENAVDIKDSTPTGTGERDYALILVTESSNATPLPDTYPALPFNTELLSTRLIDREATALGYPAESFLASDTNVELSPIEVTTPIVQLYTFGSMTADVIALQGSPLGTYGSSGGPVLLPSQEVVGVITTRGNDAEEGEGSLRAITLSHIDQTLREETGSGLQTHLSGDVAERSELFQSTLAPFLQNILYNEL